MIKLTKKIYDILIIKTNDHNISIHMIIMISFILYNTLVIFGD